MPGGAPILFFSDFPAESEAIEQAIRAVSAQGLSAVADEDSAFATLAQNAPEIVFAHLRHGAVASTTFLNEVWNRAPQTTRFLVGDSATDSDTLVRCALGPHQYIPAPLDAEKIESALKRAEALRRFIRDEKIRLLMARMRTLPSRPALSIEVMRELRSANASARAVGELVSKDIAISSKLLQVANSAFYSAQHQVTDPAEAVLLLGLESTAALVLSIETFAKLDKLKPRYFSMDRVWKHSQAVAELARKIARVMGCDAETIAHVNTAGLLHDIGKLALAQNFEEEYERILRQSEEKNLPIHDLEKKVFGVTHAEAGAYLIALWGLPLQVVEDVAFHHLSAESLGPAFSGATALRLANQLVHAPENLRKIIAEYPGELGLSSHYEELKTLLPATKVREQSAVVPIYPNLHENSSYALSPAPDVASTPAQAPTPPAPQTTRRSPVYLAFAAGIAVAAAASFFFRPQPAPLPQAPAKAGTKALAETRASELLATKGDSSTPLQPSPSEPATEDPLPLQQLIPQDMSLTPEDETVAVAPRHTDVSLQYPGGLKLQAIMYGGSKPRVIINGNLLNLSDSINGWEIVTITETEAVVRSSDQQQTLTIK